MRGLLLAGLRLASGAPVAALRVAGLSLLARAAFVARDAGVTAAVVVAERPLLPALRAAVVRADLGVELTFADPAAERDTVVKWLAGDDPVTVVRADVAHTRHASPALRDAEPGDLLVDERAEPIRGAVGLRLAAGPTWVGLAVLRPDQVAGLLDGLAGDVTRGDVLALDGEVAGRRAQTVSVTGLPWQAVRSDAETVAAQRLLLGSLARPSDGWVTTRLNRPLSLAITRVAVDLPLHPNHLSILVFAVGLAGCAAIAWGDRYWLPLLGALLIQGGAILGGCDGELARLRYQGSLLGAWLDTLGGDLVALAYTVAVTTSLARFGRSGIWTLLGVLAAVALVIAVTTAYTYLFAVGSGSVEDVPGGPDHGGRATTPLDRAWRAVHVVARRDAAYVAFLACAVVGLLPAVSVGLFVGAVVTCVELVRRRLGLRQGTPEGPDDGPGGPDRR